ncbi:hypothetical protein [Xylophilus sp.]|uniref:glycosyltransferase n=1 Tax=Xylophilus sp. TaxID=2653893 RepID=UPI003FCE2EDE
MHCRAAAGAPHAGLIVRHGAAAEVIPKLARELGVAAVFANNGGWQWAASGLEVGVLQHLSMRCTRRRWRAAPWINDTSVAGVLACFDDGILRADFRRRRSAWHRLPLLRSHARLAAQARSFGPCRLALTGPFSSAPRMPLDTEPLFPVSVEPDAWRHFPRAMRRWSIGLLLDRVAKPLDRWRACVRNTLGTAPYRRDPAATILADGQGCVVAVGDFRGRTGLSRAAQYESNKLRLRHPGLILLDLSRQPDGSAAVSARDLPLPVSCIYLLCEPQRIRRALRMFRPEQLAGARRIGLWAWENEVFPRAWHFALKLVDEVWTPSAFSSLAIRSASPLTVKVVPHNVAVDRNVAAARRADFGVPERAFLGLAIMDIRACPERKNPWAHVAAWQKAFGFSADHVLLMKVRCSDRTRIVERELEEMIGQAGNIRLICRDFTDAEQLAFQRMADVYLSLHRAEAYGLNIHEFLELGTPVVATHWSANAEYGPAYRHYHGVKASLVPYEDWMRHFSDRRFHWADADTDHAARLLRQVTHDKVREPGQTASHPAAAFAAAAAG